jgi:threonine dehydratase
VVNSAGDGNMLPTLAGVEAALKAIRPYQPETPLVRSTILSRSFRADVWLKNETVSPISSFKIRGALYALMRAQSQAQPAVAVTSSTGNHGQAVAWAAAQLGFAAEIFLPEGCNPVKKAMIQALGARLHEGGSDIDEAKDRARNHGARPGHIFVDDGENLDLMEGAGTVGLETARRLPKIQTAFVPMGSGSLVSGCAAAIKGIHPSARVIAVQAEGAPAMAESFRCRQALERPTATIADGLVCRVPADLALRAVWALVDDVSVVSDDELLAGIRTLIEECHIMVEPSAAAALAAAWQKRHEIEGQTVLLVLTGSNIAPSVLQSAMGHDSLLALGGV